MPHNRNPSHDYPTRRGLLQSGLAASFVFTAGRAFAAEQITVATLLIATLAAFGLARSGSGANRLRSFWRVAMPLTKSGLIAGFIFAFLLFFEELTIAVFLDGGLRTTLPKQIWDDAVRQVSPTLVAASVIIVVVVTSLFLLAESLRPKE